MDISPRNNNILTITNTRHNTAEETNIVALQPYISAEPTLLEIVEPEITFEALSSQLEPPCEIQ
jgi:hypothetical protein